MSVLACHGGISIPALPDPGRVSAQSHHEECTREASQGLEGAYCQPAPCLPCCAHRPGKSLFWGRNANRCPLCVQQVYRNLIEMGRMYFLSRSLSGAVCDSLPIHTGHTHITLHVGWRSSSMADSVSYYCSFLTPLCKNPFSDHLTKWLIQLSVAFYYILFFKSILKVWYIIFLQLYRDGEVYTSSPTHM